MLLLFQEPPPPDPGTGEPPPPAPPQKVEMSDEQFQLLVEQLQGGVFYLSAFLAVAVMLLGAMVLILAIGGR